MQIFERSDGVRAEAAPFLSMETHFSSHSVLINWLNANGVKSSWHAEKGLDTYYENDEGEIVEDIDVEHMMIIKDDLEAGVDEAGVEHVLTVKDGYATRVDVGDIFVLRDGDMYSMDPTIFEAVFSPVITDDPDNWDWDMTGRLPYTQTLGYWRHHYDSNLISNDGGITYWLESDRKRYHPTAEIIHTSIKKESIV